MADDPIIALIRVPDPFPVAAALRPAFLGEECYREWLEGLSTGHHAIYCLPGVGLISVSFHWDDDANVRFLKVDAAVGRGLIKYLGLLDELCRIAGCEYIAVDAIGKPQRRLFLQHGFIPMMGHSEMMLQVGYGR